MDNMLYIIAGLVLILVVAVVVLRKKKAQKPSEQSPIQANKNATINAPLSTSAATDSDGKMYDNLAVAQRFMDQQRYDKAIETLNRGLIESPNDSQLSLKLLSLYATIENSDDFYKVYDRIKTHNDAATIKQADELKLFLVEENNQSASHIAPVTKADNSDFESLDFDLPTTAQTTENIGSQVAATSTNDVNDFNVINDSKPTNDHMDDSFDLMLGALEADSDLEADNNLKTSNDLQISGLDVEELQPVAATNNVAAVSQSDSISDSIDDDFNFDFETPVSATTAQDAPVAATAESSNLEEISLDDDDFVLDFTDLVTDTDTNFDSGIDVDIKSNAAIESPVQTSEDDFTLSLDSNLDSNNLDSSLDSNNALEVEDKSFADISTPTEDTHLENSSVTPTTSLTSDNNTLIDDSVFIDDNFDAALSFPTETTPVELEENYDIESDISNDFEYNPESSIEDNVESNIEGNIESASDNVSAETPADFASRFAADFDFVKTLDSNQVTLDLASQYLQLGEYDSAKRLLNEVITQGNDEQQNQAQALLDRTA